MRIQMTMLTNGKLDEVRNITEGEYKLLTDKETAKMFRRLGGTETMRTAQTYYGLKVVRMTSTSPQKEIKIIREFKFS